MAETGQSVVSETRRGQKWRQNFDPKSDSHRKESPGKKMTAISLAQSSALCQNLVRNREQFELIKTNKFKQPDWLAF